MNKKVLIIYFIKFSYLIEIMIINWNTNRVLGSTIYHEIDKSLSLSIWFSISSSNPANCTYFFQLLTDICKVYSSQLWYSYNNPFATTLLLISFLKTSSKHSLYSSHLLIKHNTTSLVCRNFLRFNKG